MKRRADYILEQLKNNDNLLGDTTSSRKYDSNENACTQTQINQAGDFDLNETYKENIPTSPSIIENSPDKSQRYQDNLDIVCNEEPINVENETFKENIPTSPSIIENSPDKSQRYQDNLDIVCNEEPINVEISTLNRTRQGDDKEPNIFQNVEPLDTQSEKVRSASSSSSSSRSSSSSSSSSSCSSSTTTSGTHEAIALGEPSKSTFKGQVAALGEPSTSSYTGQVAALGEPSTSSYTGQVAALCEPSTSSYTGQVANRSSTTPKKNYYQSPIHSHESDVDLSDTDPTYRLELSNHVVIPPSSSSDDEIVPDLPRKSRKRQRNPANWKQNITKKLRNSGQSYVQIKTKKRVAARSIKEACTSKCRLKCYNNFSEDDRQLIFKSYWALGNIDIQRAYIKSCMLEIRPKYKYTNAAKPRSLNHAFYFYVNESKLRVCKTFFINTLSISDKMIRTVKSKVDSSGFIKQDLRGKHTENRKHIDPDLIEDIKKHINSIPRIESHYLRASTTREYISGERTIADLCRDFVSEREEGKPTCDYWLYYEIFTKEFNLGFFQPKKDKCDLCCEYELAPPYRKSELQIKYDTHLKEKGLSRDEKRLDRQNIDETHICAIYDLQAVMQCPTGDTSSFFYKSKLNCLNFTIVELLKTSDCQKKKKKKKDKNINSDSDIEDLGMYGNVYCYFWDETQAKRGANEIGSCVLDYLHILNEKYPGQKLHVTFYSDNCCGQNKNKFITALYSYAVFKFENIYSITHKYLIKGHTQNECDNAHSVIEREIIKNKKAGPIYAPYQYVTLIKNARKRGKPFIVKELTFDFFFDLKLLQEKWAYNFTENENKQNVPSSDMKILKFCKEDYFKFYYKISYSKDDEGGIIDMRNKRKKMTNPNEITLSKAYTQKQELSENKKKDLRDLINRSLIPNYYADFYKGAYELCNLLQCYIT